MTRNDFFLLLSDFEGFPLSVVEAMARGCVPVVAEMRSGVPELVASTENGEIVTGRSYDQWANVLVDLWKDQQRMASMSSRARDDIREKFTVERATAKLDCLLRDVATEISTGSFERPPSLNWGADRSLTGDVLPPPFMYRPVTISGLA